MRVLGFVAICAILFGVGTSAAPAQRGDTYLGVELTRADGRLGGRREVIATKPPDLAKANANVQFLVRRDVKDEKGRIVTGVGYVAWREGKGARVWVFSLVPKAGVANDYYATMSGIANTRREPLAEFVLTTVGQSRPLVEMKKWGFDPFVIKLIRGSR